MSIATDTPLGPPPRRAQLRRSIRNMHRAYRTLFALVILVFAGWAALDAFRWYDLAYRVQSADGKITKKQAIPRFTDHEYHLEYAFTAADGTPITADSVVAQPVFDKAVANQRVEVVYLPENPQVEHWLFDNDASRSQALYLTLGHGLAALLAIVVLRLVERPLRKELRLARLGVSVPGQIVSVGKPRGRRGTVRITYSFRTAVGTIIDGACNLPRRFPAHLLEPGVLIEVLHDVRKPRVHKPRLALDFVEFGELHKKKTS